MKRSSWLIGAILVALPAIAQEPPFREASAEWGAVLEHRPGGRTFGMAGGLAWLDLDADGDDDLFLTSADGLHRLLRNDGTRFEDITAGSGLVDGSVRDTMGVLAADFDADGRTDLYLTNHGPNQLFRSLGEGRFEDVAGSLGVAGDAWSTSAAWADFDGDGDLDLYVGNYVERIDFPYHRCTPNTLYRNVGTAAAPAFEEVAAAAGVDGMTVYGPGPPTFPWFPSPEGEPTAGCTLSVSSLDVDDDGDADLLEGNDFGLWVVPNRYFRNDTPPGGAPRFTDVSVETGFRRPQYNMGINAADYDGDGDWDIYLSDLGPNLLLRNDGGVFTDVTEAAGPVEGVSEANPARLLTSWGTVWGDFDNDGLEDLLVVNGYISAASFIRNQRFSPNHLWMNRGDGTFERVDPPWSGIDDTGAGRGVGAADADGDGLLDFFMVNNGHPAGANPGRLSGLYLNTGTLSDDPGHWLALRLRGRASHPEAIGARVDAFAGPLRLRRQVLADPVYLSSGSRVLHLGLGSAPAVDHLVVRWPSGIRQELHRLPADRRLELVEPAVTVESLAVERGRGRRLFAHAVVRNRSPARQLFSAALGGRALPRSAGVSGAEGITGRGAASGSLAPGETRALRIPIPRRGLGVTRADILLVVLADGATDSRVARIPD